MSITSIANRLVATANDLMEEAGLNVRYGIIQQATEVQEDQLQLPLEELPECDFCVGMQVIITNIKEGEIESFEGTITDVQLKDEDGEWYCRAVNDDGRKFRGPLKEGQTRKGTRFDIC